MDYDLIAEKIYRVIESHKNSFSVFDGGDLVELQKIGYKREKTDSGIVFASDTALELGAPDKKSIAMNLFVSGNSSVEDKIYIHDCTDEKKSTDFLQIVIAGVNDPAETDEAYLARNLNATGHVEGLMAKSRPGKTWYRISKNLKEKEFSIYSLAQLLFERLKSEKILKADIIIIAGDSSLISDFSHLAEAAVTAAGMKRKLRLEDDGLISCGELNCGVCEEKPACDNIKEAVSRKFK